jgi:hypothetical protein
MPVYMTILAKVIFLPGRGMEEEREGEGEGVRV